MEFLIEQYKNIPQWQIILEMIAFVFGIWSVIFAKKENILVYPTGIIATVITVYIMYQAKYMADMAINIYYTIMSFYGWYNWEKKINNSTLQITRTNFKEKVIGSLMFLITFIICVFIYKIFDIDLLWNNYIDVFTTSIFFTAMWFMAHKKIENWILWIIGNVLVVPIFCYRGLYIFAIQYIIFIILALLAYLEWKKHLQQKI